MPKGLQAAYDGFERDATAEPELAERGEKKESFTTLEAFEIGLVNRIISIFSDQLGEEIKKKIL